MNEAELLPYSRDAVDEDGNVVPDIEALDGLTDQEIEELREQRENALAAVAIEKRMLQEPDELERLAREELGRDYEKKKDDYYKEWDRLDDNYPSREMKIRRLGRLETLEEYIEDHLAAKKELLLRGNL